MFDFPYAVMMGRTVNPELRPTLDLNFRDNQDVGSDITYTGGAYRTKYDANGVLGYAPHNLANYTEDFANATWTKSGLSVAGTKSSDVDRYGNTGTMFEVKNDNGSRTWARIEDASVDTDTNGYKTTASFDVRKGNVDYAAVGFHDGGGNDRFWALYNLDTGVIVTTSGPSSSELSDVSTAIVDLGGGLYRISVTAEVIQGYGGALRPHITPADNGATASNHPASEDGDYIYAYAAQWNRQFSGDTSTYNAVATTTEVWEPRFDHVLKARTNHIRNNTMVGAVAGTPGTAPTNWSLLASGTTTTIVGVGTEGGIDYIDIRYAGTATGSTDVAFETNTHIEALTGETWTASTYLAIVGGDLTNIAYMRILMEEREDGGNYITAQQSGNLSVTSTLTRFSNTATFDGGANVAKTTPYLLIGISGPVVVDFTLRIGLPQMERTAAATDAIKTYGGAVTVDEWRDHNLLLQSQNLNTTWTLSDTTVVSNVSGITAPDGTETAESVTHDDTTAQVSQQVVSEAGEQYTASIYLKQGDNRWLRWQFLENGGASGIRMWVDLDNGTIGTSGAIGTGTLTTTGIVDEGGGWYRAWLTGIIDATSTDGTIFIHNAVGDNSATEETTTGYVWGAQVTKGSELLPYTATTTAAVAATLEYVPVGLSVYEARTNEFFYSEDVSESAASSVNQTLNTIVAPDGTTTADNIEDDDGSGYESINSNSITVANSETYTYSVFIKLDGVVPSTRFSLFRMSWSGGTTINADLTVDTSRGVIVARVQSGGGSVDDSGAEDVGNGWFRVWITSTNDTTGNTALAAICYPAPGANANMITYSSATTGNITIWGSQLEQGAFPTPYVKTTTGTVTATADVASMSDVSWFNSGSAHSWFVEFSKPVLHSGTSMVIDLETSGADRAFIDIASSNDLRYLDNLSTQGAMSVDSNIVAGAQVKAAFAIDENNGAGVRDGGTVVPDTSMTGFYTPNEFRIGRRSTAEVINGNIARITYWPRRLSDIALQNLTI